MTDARFPDRWLHDRRLMRLSDADFRSFVVSLAWSVSNRTDGSLTPDDLALVPGFRRESVRAFESAGLWQADGSSWLVVDFAATQTTKAQLDANDRQRANNRERQARHRARKGKPAAVTGDVTRDVTRENPGQDRQGQARKEAKPTTPVLDDDNGWPEVTPPGSGRTCPDCQGPMRAGSVRCQSCLSASVRKGAA